MSIITAIVNGMARNGDAALNAFITANPANLNNLVAAVRSGTLDDFLRTAEGASGLASSPLFMRTMAKLSDSITYLDEVDGILKTGGTVNADQFITRLGVNAGDDIAEGLRRGITNYNDLVAAGLRQGQTVDDLLAQVRGNLDTAVRPAAQDYRVLSASTGFRHMTYAALRTTADWLAEKGVLGQVAGLGLRATAGTVRWGLPVLATGVAGVVAATFFTGGNSTRALADAANGTLDWMAGALQETSPEAADFLRKLGPDAGEFLLRVMSEPVDTAKQFIQQTARYRGIELSDEHASALAQFMNGNPLMAALSAGGHDIDPRDVITLYRDAATQPDPQAYIRTTLQQRFGLPDQQMAEYVQRGEELRSGAGQMLERLQGYQRELARLQGLSGEGLTTEFNSVVQSNSLHMFSNVSMFLAVILDFVGANSLADQFKRAVVVDATISQFGDRFNLTGTALDPAVTRDRTVLPEPAPG